MSGVSARDDVVTELLLALVAGGQPQTLRARGGSMGAAIPDGTCIELARAERVELGDVVAVTSRHRFLVHRVVGLASDGRVLTQGDACPAPDGWHARDDVRAVVRVAVRDDGVRVPIPRTPVPPASLWSRAGRWLARVWCHA